MNNNKNNNQSKSFKSYTSINYEKLPSATNFEKKDKNDYKVKSNYSGKDVSKNYEEIDDYSFLNIITEEITTLEDIHNSNEIKELLKSSLHDLNKNESTQESISIQEIDNVISSLDANSYKAFVHNVDNFSYLEIVDQNTEHSYRLQLNREGCLNIDNTKLDDILTYLIEHNNKC